MTSRWWFYPALIAVSLVLVSAGVAALTVSMTMAAATVKPAAPTSSVDWPAVARLVLTSRRLDELAIAREAA